MQIIAFSQCFMLSVNIFSLIYNEVLIPSTSLFRFNTYKLSHNNVRGIQLYIIYMVIPLCYMF
jgi:hypothetical protein